MKTRLGMKIRQPLGYCDGQCEPQIGFGRAGKTEDERKAFRNEFQAVFDAARKTGQWEGVKAFLVAHLPRSTGNLLIWKKVSMSSYDSGSS